MSPHNDELEPTETTTDDQQQLSHPEPLPIETTGLTHPEHTKKSFWRKTLLITAATLFVLLTLAGSGLWWYRQQLTPLGSDANQKVLVKIEEGSNPEQIGQLLESQSVIRSGLALQIYLRISGEGGNLQAGTYRLSPGESIEEIVGHLTKGTVDTFTITFLPGATLKQNRDVLLKSGYSKEEVDAALGKQYNHALFAGKPTSADLEGYIYGETYQFGVGATAEDILLYIFDYYYDELQKNNLPEEFASHDLNLYQAITLASIVQREVSGPDSNQVAQVFYSRLRKDMVLGSDVTYQYITDKLGVERDVNFDSPYNTRRYPGLPPGPISVPGFAALYAVANPAKGDYLYFLSGDDDKTYFARTLEEHEQNITSHCKVKCQII